MSSTSTTAPVSRPMSSSANPARSASTAPPRGSSTGAIGSSSAPTPSSMRSRPRGSDPKIVLVDEINAITERFDQSSVMHQHAVRIAQQHQEVNDEKADDTVLMICVAIALFTTPTVLAEDEKTSAELKEESKRVKINEVADETLREALRGKRQRQGASMTRRSVGRSSTTPRSPSGISGGGGNGVAVSKTTGKKAYMKMGTGGVGSRNRRQQVPDRLPLPE